LPAAAASVAVTAPVVPVALAVICTPGAVVPVGGTCADADDNASAKASASARRFIARLRYLGCRPPLRGWPQMFSPVIMHLWTLHAVGQIFAPMPASQSPSATLRTASGCAG